MNLKELDSFKISDAVTFHEKLNPALWAGTKLRPEVKNQLEEIAKDFLEEMGINDLDVRDITISGSNAAYSYTKHSDLDLHILVNINDLPNNEIYREFFDAKKSLYNDSHNITIHGVPVELYVQDAAQPSVTLGEYSLMHDKWLKIPTKRRANFDQTATRLKYEKLLDIVERALHSKNLTKIQKVLKKIKQYRQAGLDKGGEFGPENLAFKALRSQGHITKLYDLRDKLHSEHLTIETMYQDPAKIIEDNLEEELSKEFEDYNPNGKPPGPEFKPTMPAGTVKVDVSDVYDWYKLGQHISNLKGLGKHDFGAGPPSTIFSFGDEDTEHKYIKDLEKTGLTTTDIDPIDPKQPKGMKRQKTDPTYNVNEGFDQPYPLKWEKGEHGDVDALATLSDGTYLSIMFNNQQGTEGEEVVQVEFYRNNSQEVTGEGDAMRVFATVLTAIQQYVKKYKPARLSFSASKQVEQGQNAESRAKLYDRLVQRYSKSWGYKAFRADNEDLVIYELSRIKKPVAEASEQINEYRNRMYQYIKSVLPTWPDYVLKDWIYNLAKGDHQAGVYFKPDDSFDKWGFNKETILKMIEEAGLSPDTKWQLIPDMKFTLDMFEPRTKQKLIGRAGGHSDLGMGIPRDKERHATQSALAKQQGGVRKEPVLLVKTSKGYELLEGWHRTIQHFAMYPQGYTGPAYVAVANQQTVAEASGYIPSEKEKNDPRFKTALTVDVKPDSIKKNAKAFSWLTNRAGVPPTAKPSGKI